MTSTSLFQEHKPHALIERFGSPLYVYNEHLFRLSCRDVVQMCPHPQFRAHYSAKANVNLTLLAIAREEGLWVDAASPGEVVAELEAGFLPSEIFFVVNNVSAEEMRFAIERDILMSVDSLSQLAQYGRLNPGGKVSVRFNPGIGAGHHAKVITGGKKTKFGVSEDLIPEVKALLSTYRLQLVGINQHIGSLFMSGEPFLQGVHNLLRIARQFDDLSLIDLGGGFGIPYHKKQGEPPLDLRALGDTLASCITDFTRDYGKPVTFMVEPGRYIPAECGVLLGTVHAVKTNGPDKYIGADIGFTTLARPVLYDAYHEVLVYPPDGQAPRDDSVGAEVATIVGNMCETGDYIAVNRLLPAVSEGDVLAVLDAGAYGYAMASQYNNRLRPAEVLIRENGELQLIRRRDTYEDLLRNMRL